MTPRIARAAALALLSVAPRVALADPPPVKVCVAVAGDPDESVRTTAETVTEAISHHNAVRGVADADARAALRGEPGTVAPDFVDLATARRTLRGEDRDATALDGVATRLGCGLVVEVMARPAGTLVRVYNPVQHAWPASRVLATVDATVVDGVIVPSLTVRVVPAADRSPPNDRRVTPAPAVSSPSLWSHAWPWVVVGGVALAVVGAYFLAQENVGSSTTRVTVVHAGVP